MREKRGALHETLSGLKIEQYASIGMTLFACVSSLAVFLAARASKDYTGFYVSLVVTTTLAVIADRLARFISENRHLKELQSFNPTKHDLRYLGDGNAGIDWFCDNFSGAYAVRNTVFRPRHSNVSFMFEELDRFYLAAQSLIGDGCTWYDLIVLDPDGETLAFREKLTDEQKKAHHVAVLDTTIPMFQMLILEYRHDKSAVLFGWGHDPHSSSKVYLSTDSETTRFFRDYYELLRVKHGKPSSIERLRPGVENLEKRLPSDVEDENE